MEQKQLDELNDYQGEEFIDEFVELDDIKVEPAKPKKKEEKGKKTAKAPSPEAPKIGEKKPSLEKKAAAPHERAEKRPAGQDTIPPPAVSPTLLAEKAAETPYESHSARETNEPESENSRFSRASTWKGITGILLILLALSFFTEGFSFEKAISADDAQAKALNFVNNQILQPPFYAEATATEEVGKLYKVALSVAGQPVNSYITKDGALFFPQGFETDRTLREQLGMESGQAQLVDSSEETGGKLVEEIIIDGTSGEVSSQVVPADEPAEKGPAEPATVRKAVRYWKWTFWPETVTVKKGQTLELTLGPDPAKKDVALESFTFSLPAFGIEQEIRGIATVSFVADKAGEFEFLCSNCEEFRGMTGTLLVEE